MYAQKFKMQLQRSEYIQSIEKQEIQMRKLNKVVRLAHVMNAIYLNLNVRIYGGLNILTRKQGGCQLYFMD